MGLINFVKNLIRKKKEQEYQSEIRSDIDDFVLSERMKHNIDFLKDCERKDFFTKGNYSDG